MSPSSPLPAALAALACALALGCEPEPTPAPTNATSGDATASAPTTPAAESGDTDGALPPAAPTPPGQLERQPDGVPFPMPDPLPPEARPRAPEDAAGPTAGPAPVAFWIGGRGETDGRFAYPRAIVTSRARDAVFVIDKSGRLQKWSLEGKLLAVVRTPAIEQGKPTGLGTDPDGHLLVADGHYCRILVYTPDLELVRWYGAPGPAPGQMMLVSGIQWGEGDLHYLTDYGDTVARWQVFTAKGEHVRSVGSFGPEDGNLRRPMNLCVDDAHDRVYVADAVNHRIAVFTRAGEWKGAIGSHGDAPGQLDFPYDVKLDDEGHLWVAEFGNQRVSVLRPEDGACLGTWGGPGRAPPGLNRPWGVTLVPPARAWVLDSMGDRAYALERSVVLHLPSGS